MIENLKLKNFKGIREGKLNLSSLTILLGANNSGKTTILEALFLAPNPFRKAPYVVGGYNSAVDVIHSMHETLSSEGFAFLLNKYTANKAEIECKTNGETFVLKFIKASDYIYAVSNRDYEGQYYTVPDGNEKSFGYLYLSKREHYELYSLPFVGNTLLISSRLVKAGYDYLEENWASIINLGICRKVAEEASELSAERYKDITIEPFLGKKLAIYAYLEDGTRIRLGDLGEGVQSYILARILYEIEKPEVLLWDDVEAHLNPRILLSIAGWFSDIVDEGRQVIVTTHSLEAARTIAGLNEEKAKIYLLSLENNILKTKEFTLEEVDKLVEAGIDVRVAEPLL